jgi:hypothetical protein
MFPVYYSVVISSIIIEIIRRVTQTSRVKRGTLPQLSHDRFQNSSQLAYRSTIYCYIICHTGGIGKKRYQSAVQLWRTIKSYLFPKNFYTKKLHVENKALVSHGETLL